MEKPNGQCLSIGDYRGIPSYIPYQQPASKKEFGVSLVSEAPGHLERLDPDSH